MNCPCHSGKPYVECCEPFHQDKQIPNPEQLMRSRYAAYALNLPDYIMKTTHNSHPDKKRNKFVWKKEIQQFSQLTDFVDLQISDRELGDPRSTVTFSAKLVQNGEDASINEKSLFIKELDRWYYASGTLS